MKNKLLYVFLISSCCLFNCFGPDLDEFAFFEVSTGEAEFVQLGSAKLNGLISGVGENGISDHGFQVANSQSDLVDNTGSVQQISLGQLSGNSTFQIETTLEDLDLNNIYYYRAYARSGAREVFAENIEIFSFQIFLEVSNTTIDNNSARVEGIISGLQFLGLSAADHGHVISRDNPEPTIEKDDTTSLGSLNDDGTFISHFDELEFNTTYYVRAYAKSDRVYYSDADTFRVKDGWRQVADLGVKITEASGSVVGDRGYIIFGCDNPTNCNVGAIYNEFREFDPAANGGMGGWMEKDPFPAVFNNFFDAVAFTIDETFYVGWGQGGVSFIPDWFSIEPQQPAGDWTPVFSPFGKGRAGAVAFVINGNAYVGGGFWDDGTGQNDEYYNDFWEFDPVNQNWRQVAGLPIQTNELKDPEFKGRSDAVGFALNGKGYAGSGKFGLLELNDFWEFTPPVNDQDTGKWVLHSFCPGQARFDAVAFTIGNKAYFGTGENYNNGFLNDFWEFDPSKPGTEAWKQVTSFQGFERARAVGFGINDRGYLGFGDHRVFDGNSVRPETLSDFWEYIPQE